LPRIAIGPGSALWSARTRLAEFVGTNERKTTVTLLTGERDAPQISQRLLIGNLGTELRYCTSPPIPDLNKDGVNVD
jgi:hypothetical protein